MRKFGLIGYPLGHSFSKKYFSEKFINEHITDCSYENFPITDVNQVQKLISDETELVGLNVTIPYKSEIIKFLHTVDAEAKEVGSVNVLKINRVLGEIQLAGFNSDVIGISDSLSLYLNGRIKNAIVLGSGGGSKAVCHILKKSGVNVKLISRNKQPGMLQYSEVSPQLIRNTELIVNTTPLGMYPEIEGKPDINYDLLTPYHILFDLVYNPELTTFLKMGKDKGCTIISGIKMLHSQAERAWKIWNDDKY